jgi:hypothetical protein
MTDHDAEKIQQRRNYCYLETRIVSAFNPLLERPGECIQPTKETLDKYKWRYISADH